MRNAQNKCEPHGRLGRYDVLEELGRGAMGVVYKARDPQIDRLVAIKTICNLAEGFEVEEVNRTRFMVEARAAGRLSHRGIVQVFDVGEEEISRTPYIVMEYVPGVSLSRMLAGGTKLPAEVALRLVQEIADALAYAHSQGVVHRDIKPSNIMVDSEGHAKITDLGVSKVDLGNGTLAGQLVGTPAYMAPEQLKNSSEVDGRSDLFSVGVLLYCMLSGHRPFQGNSPKTVAFRISHHNPVPVTALNLDLPAAIDYVLARAMAKDPAERYQSGTEMALDLQDLREERQPRSWTNGPGKTGSKGQAKTPDDYLHFVADIANTSYLRRSQAKYTEELISPKRTLAVTGFTPHVRVLLAAAVALGLAYLGFRALFLRAAATASATPLPVTVTARVPSHKPTTRVGVAGSSLNRPVDSVPVFAQRPPETRKGISAPEGKNAAGSTVQIVVDHQFRDARISVWVDERLAFSDTLQGQSRRHLFVLHGISGKQSRVLALTAGEHRLRVRIQSPADGYDLEEIVLGIFEANTARTLRVKCDRGNRKLQLTLASAMS